MQLPKQPDIHSDEFLHALMRKQLRLSIACAASFLLVLMGLPLANYFWPELMAQRVFGFTLTWLVLASVFFRWFGSSPGFLSGDRLRLKRLRLPVFKHPRVEDYQLEQGPRKHRREL